MHPIACDTKEKSIERTITITMIGLSQCVSTAIMSWRHLLQSTLPRQANHGLTQILALIAATAKVCHTMHDFRYLIDVQLLQQVLSFI